MQELKVIKNFFSNSEIKIIKDYAEEYLKSEDILASDKIYEWQKQLNTSSARVKIYKINKKIDFELYDIIHNKMSKEFGLKLSAVRFYYWTNSSNINWHDDGGFAGGATIYLNQKWKRDWGGYFVYEKDKKLGIEIPEYNKCIFQYGAVPHATTPVSEGAPIRKSLQIFFKK